MRGPKALTRRSAHATSATLRFTDRLRKCKAFVDIVPFRCHLKRIFKQAFGQTMSDYLNA